MNQLTERDIETRNILLFLSDNDCLNACMTSKSMYKFMKEKQLWKQRLQLYHPGVYPIYEIINNTEEYPIHLFYIISSCIKNLLKEKNGYNLTIFQLIGKCLSLQYFNISLIFNPISLRLFSKDFNERLVQHFSFLRSNLNLYIIALNYLAETEDYDKIFEFYKKVEHKYPFEDITSKSENLFILVKPQNDIANLFSQRPFPIYQIRKIYKRFKDYTFYFECIFSQMRYQRINDLYRLFRDEMTYEKFLYKLFVYVNYLNDEKLKDHLHEIFLQIVNKIARVKYEYLLPTKFVDYLSDYKLTNTLIENISMLITKCNKFIPRKTIKRVKLHLKLSKSDVLYQKLISLSKFNRKQ